MEILDVPTIEYATASEKMQTPTQDQTMTGGPPDSAPIIRTPDKALQQVTILKLKPIMLRRLKLRFSSVAKVRFIPIDI